MKEGRPRIVSFAVLGATAFGIVGLLVASKRLRRKRESSKCVSCSGFSRDSVSVSAPGKALVAGGYLVLERPNEGVVLACNARFYTSMRWMKRERRMSMEQDVRDTMNTYVKSWDGVTIRVESPQFKTIHKYNCRMWTSSCGPPQLYWCKRHDGLDGGKDNPYVNTTLRITLNFLKEKAKRDPLMRKAWDMASAEGWDLCIKLRGNNNFYSQINQLKLRNLSIDREGLESLPQFLPLLSVDGNLMVTKTGMGSSATLITSLVGCLVHFFTRKEGTVMPTHFARDDLRQIHNLAQVCHASAQGKVGSGFDVSAAIYGSQVYTRFSPSVIRDILDAYSSVMDAKREGGRKPCDFGEQEEDGCDFTKQLLHVVEDEEGVWNALHTHIRLPSCFRLRIGDVKGGSETPSMVRKVLTWKASNIESSCTWQCLADVNSNIVKTLENLRLAEEQYSEIFATSCMSLAEGKLKWGRHESIDAAECTFSGEYVVLGLLFKLRVQFIRARQLLKEMGDKAGVPIEPESQTKLADATMEIPGVLCCGVPGAGGEDAIFAIAVHHVAVKKVETLWRDWESVCPLTLDEDPGAGLRVNEELSWEDDVYCCNNRCCNTIP